MSSLPHFSAHPKILQNKYGACDGCGACPPPGRKFSVCRGCRLHLYCSRECQAQAWESHRLYCKQSQYMFQKAAVLDQARDPALRLPSLVERIVLLRDFEQVHNWSFQKAVYSMARARPAKHGRASHLYLDFTSPEPLVRFSLSYRPDHDGNPAKAFVLTGVTVEDASQWLQQSDYCASWECRRAAREAEAAALRSQFGGDFLCHLPVLLFIDGEFGHWYAMPILRPEPDLEVLADKRVNHDAWFEVLRQTIGRGLVFDETDEESDGLSVGEMVRLGKVWYWRPCSPEKLAAMGLPPGFKTMV